MSFVALFYSVFSARLHEKQLKTVTLKKKKLVVIRLDFDIVQ